MPTAVPGPIPKPDIVAALQAAMTARSERTQIRTHDVIREYARIAFTDIPLDQIHVGDKVRALDALARHLGLFNDKLVVTGNLTLEQLVLGSLKPEDEEQE